MNKPTLQSKRRQIVEAVANRLQDANVTDAVAWFRNPFRQIAEDELPCLKIAIMNEPMERMNTQIEYDRSPVLVVAYCAKGGDELADNLYYYGERIENFLINDENTTQVGGELDDLVLQEMNLSLENAEMGIGAIVMKFQGRYVTNHAPDFEYLDRIHVEIRPKDVPEDEPLFEETITLPQS